MSGVWITGCDCFRLGCVAAGIVIVKRVRIMVGGGLISCRECFGIHFIAGVSQPRYVVIISPECTRKSEY